ncbi:MFS transporter [Dactylosporangium sp. NPDC005572]|uniref:MFS transporter n=1 Tax=Dactylosporangium sp. NPDC005572 TaxID=3156889 RepID=UPI0033A62FFF
MPLVASSPRLTFWVLSVSICSYSLLQSVSVPTLPLIQEELDASQSTAVWTLTAFLLSASVATPIMGRLGDSFGKRRMLVWSLAALAVGAIASAAAPTIEVMIAARALQGIGGGAVPLSFAIVRDELPPEKVPAAISLNSAMLAIGFAGGIVFAGPVASALGFRYVFLLPAVLSVVSSVVTWLVVPESPMRTRARVSIVPAVLLAGWLVSLLLGVSNGPHWGWASPAVLSLLAAAAVLATLWAWVERRIDVPLIDLRLMTRRGVWTANLVALAIGMTMYGIFGFLPQFAQTPPSAGYGFGMSVTEAGHMMLPSAATTFFSGMVSARLAARIGIRQVIVLGCLVSSGSLILLAYSHGDKWETYLAAGLTGFGTGLVFASLANVIVAAVSFEHTGVATGMNANIRTMGGTIGTALMTTLVTARLLPSGHPQERGYVTGFVFIAGAAFVAGLAGMLIPGSGSTSRTVRDDVEAVAADVGGGTPRSS